MGASCGGDERPLPAAFPRRLVLLEFWAAGCCLAAVGLSGQAGPELRAG